MSWTRRHKHVAARVGTVDETKLAAADGGRVAVDLDRTACAAASELGNHGSSGPWPSFSLQTDGNRVSGWTRVGTWSERDRNRQEDRRREGTGRKREGPNDAPGEE